MKVVDSHRKLSSFYGVVDHHYEVRSSGHTQADCKCALPKGESCNSDSGKRSTKDALDNCASFGGIVILLRLVQGGLVRFNGPIDLSKKNRKLATIEEAMRPLH